MYLCVLRTFSGEVFIFFPPFSHKFMEPILRNIVFEYDVKTVVLYSLPVTRRRDVNRGKKSFSSIVHRKR